MWKGRGPEGRAIGPFAVGSRRLSMANPSAFPYPSTGHGLQPHLMLSRMNLIFFHSVLFQGMKTFLNHNPIKLVRLSAKALAELKRRREALG